MTIGRAWSGAGALEWFNVGPGRPEQVRTDEVGTRAPWGTVLCGCQAPT